MNTIVKKLSEMEHAASAIVKHAEEEKHSLELQIQKERDLYDSKLEEETQAKLAQIRKQMEEKMSEILEQERKKDSIEIEKLKQDFEEHHTEYAKTIVKEILEG